MIRVFGTGFAWIKRWGQHQVKLKVQRYPSRTDTNLSDPKYPLRDKLRSLSGDSPTPKHILLVEDDIDLNEALQEFLCDLGFDVHACANGQEGMDRLEVEIPDLLLIDGTMPILSGLDVLKRIRGRSDLRYMPVILMSAEDLGGFKSEYHWSEFFRKPLQFEKLSQTIYNLIDHPPRPTISHPGLRCSIIPR